MPDQRVLAELSASTGVTDLREIGRGAAATVYLGRQPQFDRAVAVKILNAELVDDSSRRRFARERQALGRVGQHPNVVSVHSSGTTPSGYAYLVMDYCQGGSLAARLPGQPLTPAEATDIGVKLASALAWAHAAAMLHRDIKPANVLLTSLGQPVLADFGIAAVELGEMSVTLHESLTPIHAAPEVLLNGGGDPRSDVWSLASTIYALVAGRPPFAAQQPESLMAVLTRVMQSDLPPLTAAGSGPLMRALAGALTKDPAARIQTAAEFGAALQQAQRECGVPVTTFLSGTTPAQPLNPASTGPPPPAGPPPGSAAGSPPYPPVVQPRRGRRVLAGSLAGAGIVIAVAVVLITRGGDKTAPGAARPSSVGATPSASTSPTPSPTPSPATTSAVPSPTPSASAAANPSGPALQARPITRVSPMGAGELAFMPAVTSNAFDTSREAAVAGKSGPDPAGILTRDLVLGTGKALAAGYTKGFVIRETEFTYGDGAKSEVDNWTAIAKEPGVPEHAMVDFLDLDTVPGLGIVGMKPGGRREIVAPEGPGAAYTYIVDYLGPR